MVSSVLGAACLVLWSGGASVGWDLFVAGGKDGFFWPRMHTDKILMLRPSWVRLAIFMLFGCLLSISSAH